jgi:hypothetical protein
MPSVCRSQEPCLLAAAFLLMGAATAALTLVQQTGQPKSQIQALVDAMDGSVLVYKAMSGADDPSGVWTVTVRRLIGLDGNGGRTIVDGPWVFSVRVP